MGRSYGSNLAALSNLICIDADLVEGVGRSSATTISNVPQQRTTTRCQRERVGLG